MSDDLKVSRREAIASGAAAVTVAALADQSTASQPKTPWIDAHSHIWTPDTSVFKLQPGMTPDDLAPQSFTDDELMAVEPRAADRAADRLASRHRRHARTAP